jgi:hypothetical protein
MSQTAEITVSISPVSICLVNCSMVSLPAWATIDPLSLVRSTILCAAKTIG